MTIWPSGTIVVKKVNENDDWIEEVLDPSDIGAAYHADLVSVSGTTDQNSLDISTNASDIVDNSAGIVALSGYTDDNYVSISGDTMTGPLNLNTDPTVSGQAATKQYVDSKSVIQYCQVDFELGTDLDTSVDKLPMNTNTVVGNSSLFEVENNAITISDAGVYKVSWSVCSYLPRTARDRKTLLTNLNQNDGTQLLATLQGGYVRDGNQSGHTSTAGSYYITTSGSDETIAVRAGMYGDLGQTFPVAGGFLNIEMVELS